MGKSSILMVMGFNVIFAMMGFNLSHVTGDAVKNYSVYYANSQAHNVAASAANIAANQIFFTPNWRDGYTNVPFGGGSYSVQVTDLTNRRIQVRARATFRGPNPNTGNYEDKLSTIVVIMQPSTFSKFAYYSAVEGTIYWITGDTVLGPFHTQDKLKVSGNPVFYGKVTARLGKSQTMGSSPKFYGGFQSGVSLTLPTDMNPLKASAASGGKVVTNMDVNLTFNADGTVTVQEGGGPVLTMPLTTYSPNGVIVVDGGNLRIKGTLDGRATIAALTGTQPTKGTVYLDDDVRYKTNPTDPACDDMLGIVADKDILVADNANNNASIDIHASMFARTGGFGAENYASRGVDGTINLVGGVQQYQRKAVGTFSGSTITSGFRKNYKYDDRLMIDLPPFYPTTGSYEIVSWYE